MDAGKKVAGGPKGGRLMTVGGGSRAGPRKGIEKRGLLLGTRARDRSGGNGLKPGKGCYD